MIIEQDTDNLVHGHAEDKYEDAEKAVEVLQCHGENKPIL